MKTNMIAIVKAEPGIERQKLKPRGNGQMKYPWETMEVGESFLIQAKTGKAGYNLADMANKKYAPKKFSAGKDLAGNPRVWRVQ